MSGRLSGTQTRANGGHLRHFKTSQVPMSFWEEEGMESWKHLISWASCQQCPPAAWQVTPNLEDGFSPVGPLLSLGVAFSTFLYCIQSVSISSFLTPRNPEIPRPTFSATVRSWTVTFASVALWLRSSLIYWKQSNKWGNPKINNWKTRIQASKMRHWTFLLGDWKAQKCLAGTVQGPWGPRKNNIPYSKTSAGMGKHRNYIEMIWTKTEMKYLWRTNKMMQCSNVHLNGSIVFYVDIVWMGGCFEVYQSE